MQFERFKDLIPKSIFDADFGKGNIGWCSHKNVGELMGLNEGTILVPQEGSLRYIPISRRTRLDLVMVNNPRKAFIEVLENYNPELKTEIHPTAKIGKNTVIHEGTVIGENVLIGDNCVIGGDGFGYEDGQFIPHRGNVVIKNNVSIGSNVCIDRAVMGSTILHENVKIDNLVHIAHGVEIGERSMIIAGAVLCGSVKIGTNVWVSPNASIIQNVTIGDNSVIGLGAVVIRNVEPNSKMVGNPAVCK